MVFDQRRIAFIFTSLSFLSIGVIQLYSDQILLGRPPFVVPGGWHVTFFAWTIGVLSIICGILAMMGKAMPILSAITATFVICYGVIPNLWFVVNGDTGIALTGFGKGISLATGLLVLMTAAPSLQETPRSKVIMQVCNYAFGFLLTASGIQHFLFAPFVMTLIPSWIPFAGLWTYAAGALLGVSGLCLITGFKRRMALRFSAFMILSWVFIVHIPRAFFTVANINEWTALFEALAFASLLFILSFPNVIKLCTSANT